MRYPRVLVYEREGKLAWMLENAEPTARAFLKKRPGSGEPRPTDAAYNWMLRQPRQLASFLRLLRGGGPAIAVFHVAGKIEPSAPAEERATEQRRRERALRLLERVAWLRPETHIIAVSEVADDALAGLAWELGATYVLLPPQPLHALPGVVAALMQAATGRQGAAP